MPHDTKADAQLGFRIPRNQKRIVEQAATLMGQSVSQYAIVTLVQHSRHILENRDVTVLSKNDSEAFMAALDYLDARPNAALRTAARRYRKQFRV